MRALSLSRVALFPLALTLAACSDQGVSFVKEDPIIIDDGIIRGRVCDPSGRTWLPDALAYVNIVDENGVIYDTKQAFSDLDGRWEIADLPGERSYTVYVQYGSQTLSTEEVYIASGQTVELPEPDCFDPIALDVAIVTGDYDDFDILLDRMGFANYDLVDGQDATTVRDFLANPEALARYDIIFFNGGFVEDGVIYNSTDPTDPVVAQNVQNVVDYVNAGGSIYASDWAYDLVEVAWPDRVDFVGADEIRDDAQLGDYETVNAAISDASMSEFLGKQYLEVDYDLPVWPPIESTASLVSTHLTGTVPYSDGLSDYTLTSVPLLVSFNAGSGKVAFSTFRMARNANQDMVNVLQYMMYNL